ncbi:helix-turn-helix domain-containing protein [Nocardia niwae]|uniref:helix-turn-helix domain-containing protein n=1 Tax=Nocardia niwae TaxID=626084 RepID=UPI0007A3A4D3|nr:helix-turn-helix domain-containing protein [Nocardia niwae]
MARKRTTPVETLVETQRKRNLALEMRLAGKSQAQITEEMGVHKSTVSMWIKEAIADITRENAQEYLELELSRLDAMWAAIWKKIVNPKNAEERKAQTWMIDRALAIMEQRAKLTGTYKAAELKAIADAKGGVGAETLSMIGNFFGKLEELVAADQLADNPESDDSNEEDDTA